MNYTDLCEELREDGYTVKCFSSYAIVHKAERHLGVIIKDPGYFYVLDRRRTFEQGLATLRALELSE